MLAHAHSGNTHLAKYTETHDGSDLLAAYNIAQSVPIQAVFLCAAHTSALELFLESLYSNLRLHARDVPQPTLEHAAVISRLSLLIRPVERDTRTGFLEARALGLETLLSHLGSNSPATSALLMEAIILRRRLKLLAISQEERRVQNTNLASLLWTYWRVEERDLVVLREEIQLRREILQAQGNSDEGRALACRSLAASLRALHKSTGDLTLLDEDVELEREALRLRPTGHPDRALSCAGLANSLWTRFSKTGNAELLDEALKLEREVLLLQPEGHPDHSRSLGNLAVSLRTRFSQNGATALLDEAIELQRKVLRLRPGGHPGRASALGNLAVSLRTRFSQTGDTLLLDETLELQREVIRLRPSEHPDCARAYGNLAVSLWTRFNQTGDTMLLGEALELETEALRLRPDGHPGRARSCGNLAVSLKTCFDLTGDTILLNKSIELERETLRLRPEGYPSRARSCENLAISLRTCFDQTGDIALLDEALNLERETLRLCPKGHPQRAHSCGNLAMLLRIRFNQTADTALLGEASLLCTEAIREIAVSPSDHVRLRVELAYIHALPASPLHDSSAAIKLLLEAIQYRAGLIPNFYFISDTLRLFVITTCSPDDSARLLAVYKVIIEVLPELGSVLLDKASRLKQWHNAGNLPLEALLHSLRANNMPLGLELLEQGRAVLWSQTLTMQDPQLRGLTDTWRTQVQTLLRSMSSVAAHGDVQPSHRNERDQAHGSYSRLQNLLREIRATPGLERFLQGPSYNELVQVASAHPVIVVAADDTACHALIVSSASASPRHIVLGLLAASDIEHLGQGIRGLDWNARTKSTATDVEDVRGIAISGRREDPAIRKLHQVLERLWVSLVKPVLDCLGLEVRE
jgi:hypothetical protein